MKNKNLKICFLSTYIPRECGIATYTNNLITEIKKVNKNINIEVAAINDKKYKYPKIVKYIIDQQNKNDYIRLAKKLNNTDIDVVSLQHEFGIFGGFNGRMILDFLQNVKKSVVMTMHTVSIYQNKPFKIIPKRYKSRTKLLKQILPFVSAITVMTDTAKKYLINTIGIQSDKIFVVPHGAPLIKKEKLSLYKKQKTKLGFKKDDFVITTFGLITPKKGIEYAIKAMPDIIKKNYNKNIVYLIAGKMHPKKPISYLNGLKKLTKKLGIGKNVIFDSRYLTYDEIYKYLANTDIYITPYYTKEQASSGTLSYAISSGRAIVSTPYIFAQDIIKYHQVGELVNFKDPKSISEVINKLIKNPQQIKKYQQNSYQFGKNIEWDKVAKQFIKLFKSSL